MLVTIKQFFVSYLVVDEADDQQEDSRLQLAAAVLLVEMMRMDDVIKDVERGKVHEIIMKEFGLRDE